MEETLTAKHKSKRFAIRIVRLYQYLCQEKKEFVMSKQLLKSGTSIGANMRRVNVLSAKKIFFQKSILHSKNAAKRSIGLTCSMKQSI